MTREDFWKLINRYACLADSGGIMFEPERDLRGFEHTPEMIALVEEVECSLLAELSWQDKAIAWLREHEFDDAITRGYVHSDGASIDVISVGKIIELIEASKALVAGRPIAAEQPHYDDDRIREVWGSDVTIAHTDGPRVASTTVSDPSGNVLFRASGPSRSERIRQATTERAGIEIDSDGWARKVPDGYRHPEGSSGEPDECADGD